MVEALKKEKLKELVLKEIKRDRKFRDNLYYLIIQEKGEIVTNTYLDRQLAKQSKEFDEKLNKLAKEFDEKLNKLAKEFDEKLNKLAKEFDEKLDKLAREFDEKLTAALAKQSKEFDEKLSKLAKEFDEKLTLALAKQSKEFDEKLLKQREEIVKDLKKHIDSRLGAIGSRWGEQTEAAFLEGMKALFEKEYAAKVEKWQYNQVIPELDSKRKRYEVDVYITYDDKVILVEYKSCADDLDDIDAFYMNIRAYEHVHQRLSHRKLLLCSWASDKVKEYAKQYAIEVISPN